MASGWFILILAVCYLLSLPGQTQPGAPSGRVSSRRKTQAPIPEIIVQEHKEDVEKHPIFKDKMQIDV